MSFDMSSKTQEQQSAGVSLHNIFYKYRLYEGL